MHVYCAQEDVVVVVVPPSYATKIYISFTITLSDRCIYHADDNIYILQEQEVLVARFTLTSHVHQCYVKNLTIILSPLSEVMPNG